MAFQVKEKRKVQYNEGKTVGQTDLRQMQGYPPQRRRYGYLLGPEERPET